MFQVLSEHLFVYEAELLKNDALVSFTTINWHMYTFSLGIPGVLGTMYSLLTEFGCFCKDEAPNPQRKATRRWHDQARGK